MFYLEAGHYQQQGVFNVHPGDHLELRTRETGIPYCTLELTGVHPVNKSFVIVDFDENQLPASFTEGDPGWILETGAELEVTDTVCNSLNSRGVLASGLKKVHISGCTFHTPGSGVFISGDHAFWYESGPVAEAVIENNIFDNCNYSPTGATREPLAIFPELRTLADNFFYHGRIAVKNNRFIFRKRTLISMMSVTDAIVTDNVFEEDNTYSIPHKTPAGYFFTDENSPMAAFKHCRNVTIKNNSGFDLQEDALN